MALQMPPPAHAATRLSPATAEKTGLAESLLLRSAKVRQALKLRPPRRLWLGDVTAGRRSGSCEKRRLPNGYLAAPRKMIAEAPNPHTAPNSPATPVMLLWSSETASQPARRATPSAPRARDPMATAPASNCCRLLHALSLGALPTTRSTSVRNENPAPIRSSQSATSP